MRRRLAVRGVVQGVGFRPYVWSLATRHDLAGSVCNTRGAVIIEVEGPALEVAAFETALVADAPPLARITSVQAEDLAALDEHAFRIVESRSAEGEWQPVSPDAATCPACVHELLDPDDRRYRYPFLNCTNCGPRFTIITDLPYDRPTTTMRGFSMCADCRREYHDVNNRRFHAQPTCCPRCGPRLRCADANGTPVEGDPVAVAVTALHRGAIVAIKGLGGFQLACLAGDESAVTRLRRRKHRPRKPFAVMVASLSEARRIAVVDASTAAIVESPAHPIVLTPLVAGAPVAAAVTCGLTEIGLMLPTTPLHHLLLLGTGEPLVMTSGNRSEEPIAKNDDDALVRLGGIADLFLLHDRPIEARYDDSVVRLAAGAPRMVRRARGHCPLPIPVEVAGAAEVLALGAQLKNTFCILRDGQAVVGPHIGDLDDAATRAHQEEALVTALRLFGRAPEVVACDLHPDYASTALARRWWDAGATPVQVQHHHAHIASVMAEHGLRGPLLGVAFDGTGLGTDGTVWGGELLLCDEREAVRVGHLTAVPLPGGDRCAREGWRMAAAYHAATPPLQDGEPAVDAARWRALTRVAASPATPMGTSCGRLFDAVASILGIAQDSSFEGEAAMRLEAAALATGMRPGDVSALPVSSAGDPLVLDAVGLVGTLAARRRAGCSAGEAALVFHESLAVAVARACRRLAAAHGVERVALSGGVFQNRVLLERLVALLLDCQLHVYANRDVPANDGGISLGQALVGAARCAGTTRGGGAVWALR